MKKFTHTGVYKNPIGGKYPVQLRETERYWIDQHGTKYKKENGYMVGDKYPMCGLMLCSIKMTEGAKQ